MNLIADSCTIKNGGCGEHALCLHDPDSFAIVCACKVGYTNIGDEKIIKCVGMSSIWSSTSEFCKHFCFFCR